MKILPIGVVGCGVLGSRHAEIYKSLPDVQLVGIYDISESRAQSLANRLNVKAFANLNDLTREIQAASVCTPAVSHHDVASPLLLSGLHLLVEKPIATSLKDADHLIQLAQNKSLILQTGHVERFNGAVMTVKNIVHNPLFIECDRIGYFDPRISDVGVVLDLMIHDIDIILYLVNSKVIDVQAFGMSVLSKTEDFANVRLRFANGAIANLTASRMAQKRIRKLRIFEENRYISLDYYQQEALTFSKDSGYTSESFYQPLDIRKTNSLEDELKHFVGCIQGTQKPRVKNEEARAALDVALQILQQIEPSHAKTVRHNR